jgi:hypothetical protein
MLNWLESVGGDVLSWDAAALCSVDKVNWRRAGACKDWGDPSRGVRWSRAGLGRASGISIFSSMVDD